jgi:hypothetical protein
MRFHIAPQRYHRTVGVPWACVEDTTLGPDTLGVQSYNADSPQMELKRDLQAFGNRLESSGSSTSATLPPDSQTALGGSAGAPAHSRVVEERHQKDLRSVSPLQEVAPS